MSEHQISRRVVLRGLTAAVALPWLESAKVLAAKGDSVDDAPPKRFAFLFFGDGIHPPQWWAKGTGQQLELGEAFQSLKSIQHKVNFINGLCHPSNVVGGHAKGAAGILTGIQPKGGREIRAETSLDQHFAKKLGDATVLPSLVLACERSVSGFHESGYSMMYSSHVSWSSPVSPVPAELYPALAFDSLFESKGNKVHLSVLDQVMDQLKDVSGKVSGADKAKIDEYTTSVREVEQRLAKLEKQSPDKTNDKQALKGKRPPEGLPETIDEHSRLMCDVIALAFQTDRTRIATLLLTNNLSGQVYPFLGLRSDHHNYSHNWNGKEFAAISQFWVGQYAYLLNRLDAMKEADGTVLDHSCIMLANEQWTAHNAPKVPLLMAGSLGGKFKTGRALDFENSKNRKMSSLYLNIMDRMGLPMESYGNSSEHLADF
ncbi:MAG: DUF1552 domain-containing protein [Zavarzinella sp.]